VQKASKEILTKALRLIQEAKTYMEEVRDTERDEFDGKPDSWKESDKGEAESGKLDALDSALENVESVETELENDILAS
jgi:hypothetical protein